MKLTKGQWAYWQLDNPMPDRLKVYEGSWKHRIKVGEITRYQAMAYYRHWDNGGVWYTVKDGNHRNLSIRVVGDVAAFYGDED